MYSGQAAGEYDVQKLEFPVQLGSCRIAILGGEAWYIQNCQLEGQESTYSGVYYILRNKTGRYVSVIRTGPTCSNSNQPQCVKGTGPRGSQSARSAVDLIRDSN